MTEPSEASTRLTRENRRLRERLRLLEDALEHMYQGFCVFDAEGRIAASNRRYAEVLGLPPDEVRPGVDSRKLVELGMQAGIYPPSKTADELYAAMWNNLTCSEEERQTLVRAGRVLASHPTPTPSGHIVATFEDVTERTTTEAALRASEARLSAILDAMPDCVKIFAEDGTLTYINPQGLKLLQAGSFEELSSAERPVVPAEYVDQCLDVHRRVITGEAVNWTYEIIGLKGRRLHVEANAVPFRLPDGSKAHLCISRDISERKMAEDALRRSEERLRLVQEATGLADFEAGPEGISICSKRLLEQAGLPLDITRMSYEEWIAIVHPEDRASVSEAIEQTLSKNETCVNEFRIVRPDTGEVRWVSSYTKVERDEHGEPLRSIGAHLDITDRKRAEEAVRESEACLRAILDAIPDSVKIYAEDGTLTYINPQGLEQLQAESLAQIAALKEQTVAPEHLADSDDVHRRVIGGETIKGTYELIGLKGRGLHVEATAVPFLMPDGSRAHMCISRDVSERLRAETALRRSEERLRLVLDATGLADFEAGPDGVALCSERMVAQSGLPPDTKELKFDDWNKLVHPDDRADWQAGVERALTQEDVYWSEFRIVRPDNGEIRWITSRTMVERDETGKAIRSIGAHLDITDRKRAEDAVRESEERFRLAAEAAALGVWDYDPTTDKREWSDRLVEIFGFGRNVKASLELAADLVHEDDRPRFLELLHDMRDNPCAARFAFTFRITRASDLAERWLTMNGWKAENPEAPSRIILTVRDVTEERTAEERIRWNASHDGLTQLANRSNFQEQVENAVRNAKKDGTCVGLLMIDLDHFKQVNDALGHQAGDRLLQSFADRLRDAVRPSDTVARFGGDEFAILVPQLSAGQDLAQLCSSIHERLREPFIQNGRVLDCRVSIGAAVYPQHGVTPKDLMVSADMALYAAKAEGRATTIEYQPHLRDEMQRSASMVSTAREAIHDGRIVPYYQPKLDLAEGTIVGFEALLRWRDRKDYVHLPGAIAAAFEDHEVAAEISDRIIGQAIADMRSWLEQGVAFGHVAVNASAAEFRRDDFAERVLEALHKAEIPIECFQLEVTETVFLGRGAEYVQRALTLLNDNGVKIALDDFGTGYASLRHLKQFPVDMVKIDKSFVRDMEDDPNDLAIIRAVVDLGKNLGIKVVAEGIENMRQAERLIELGCTYGQGFLFSKAVPGGRVPALVSSFAAQPAGQRPGRKLKLVGEN